jgi:predicted transposase/invertase (TIGR01784 family)
MRHQLLDPRNDFVFGLLFSTSLPLLSDLINAVRSKEPPLTVISVEDPLLKAREVQGKYVILDILAKDETGQILNIEMQMTRHEKWSARSTYYLAKAFVDQLKTGESYHKLKPVIGIHFLAYDLFPKEQQMTWCFEMRDGTNPAIKWGRELQLNIVELKKAARLAANKTLPDSCSEALLAWITYFTHWKDEDIMNQIDHPPVLEAMQVLHDLSDNEENRRLAELRERALMLERTEIEGALERGVAIGKAEALRAMIASGISEAQARTILGM